MASDCTVFWYGPVQSDKRLDRAVQSFQQSPKKATVRTGPDCGQSSIDTPSITPGSVVPPSCPALSTVSVVVAIGPAGSTPIGRGDSYGAVQSVRGLVGVVIRFRVQSFGSEFWVGVWLELGGVTHYYLEHQEND